MKSIIVENIRLNIDCGDGEAVEEAKSRLKESGQTYDKTVPGRIYRKSIDARHKNDIKFVYSVIFGENKDNPEDINIKSMHLRYKIAAIRTKSGLPLLLSFALYS